MEDAKEKIKELVERFHLNLDAYKSGSYNETQLRREFIDPFFEALGWDVQNKQGYAEQYKEVVHEDSIKVGISLKAPDYSFRIGGQRKFFLETKKPAINIKEDTSPAYQLRRYAWSAKLPLSILTDFEEFAIYDCRIKPNPSDKVSTGRITYYTYEQYIGKFGEIYDRFSKEAVLKGSFDRYIETTKGMRGTAEVDKEFLREIESWRESLAKNLALRNPRLTVDELNFAVQQTIDRIIFLRICEDRGIESYGRLQALLNGTNTYRRLFEQFYQADAKYNSGLFDFTLDKLTSALSIDDKILKDIIESLYYPNSPYEFSVLGAEILGNVYEQFLGKVIRLTLGHAAKVEEKPEVKKAGGVYYTPNYIVRYIVENTVGRLLGDGCATASPILHDSNKVGWVKRSGTNTEENCRLGQAQQTQQSMTPKDVSKLRILDPACGSGSFLIGTYQHLLDWHTRWYNENNPEKHATGKKPAVYKNRAGWQLTTTEKKRILLNNIYGVDIDRQAVEVTKLSLLLKVLEGENEETIGKTLALFRERALPNLKDNIKCGNSLIGPDFYNQTEFGFNVGAAPRGRPNEGRHMGLPLQDDEIRRINIFDWNDDEKGFGKVMKDGGFDCVIGNPPYVQSRSGLLAEADKAYYMAKFKTTEYQINTYGLFVEQGVNLLKADGILGMIIPNYWLATNYDKKLRDFLFLNNNVIELANVYKVFTNATVDTLLLFVSRPRKTFFPKQFLVKGIDRSLKTIPDRLLAVSKGQWVYQQAYNVESSAHDVRVSFTESLVLRGNTTLGDYFSFKFGMKPYEQGKGNPPQTREMMNRKVYDSKTKRDDTYKPLLGARNVKRYRLGWQKDWIKYGENLAAPRDPEIFNGPRILIQRIVSGKYLDGVYTDKPFICNTDVITLKPLPRLKNTLHIYFFAGILLSRLCSSFLKSQNVNLDREAFPKINANTLERFVVPTINTSNPTDKATHDKIASLVDNMLKLNIKLKKIKTPHEKELLERQIKITDNQIDRLVYELYGLTEEEIKVVEGKEQK